MSDTILEVQHLTKSFGDLKAVDDLNFNVGKGEVFGFLGPNGAGKTTSIRMMCGLLQPDDGIVNIFGKGIYNGDSSILHRVGICPQDIVIWKKLTCLEQLVFIAGMYGIQKRDAKKRALKLLEKLGLQDKSNSYGKNLSGGMKRRLNILLGLMHDPDVIFLDEPEAGLDPQSRIVVREFIRSMAKDKLIILTTHNMDEADRLAERIAIIDRGKLLVIGTSEELKKSTGEGDLVDLDLKGIPVNQVQTIPELLEKQKIKYHLEESTLYVNSRNMMEDLPLILQLFESKGIKPGELHWRKTTLEDVFISLTGRGLRQ